MVLIVLAQVKGESVPLRQSSQRGGEPGGQRVRVDHHGDPDATSAGQRTAGVGQRLPFEQRELAGQAQQGSARLGRHTRSGPRTSTWPTVSSSALIRWLTADGVTCSSRAAASKLPSATTAASVRSCAESRPSISRA